MHNLFTITKTEFKRFFISPLAYIYLVAFLLLNGSFTIYVGDFFNRGQAELNSMFSFIPWIYLIFIPGISMRLWAEEFRLGTVVSLMTLPVTTSNFVWGKFLAAWLFCGLGLILTFPFWIMINILGTPDNAVVLSGYLGCFFLSGCMLSISQTMSALTKNQVIALVLSVFANLIFFLSGLEFVLSVFRGFSSQTLIDLISSFSFLTHFNAIANGLLELRDLVFFGSIIILFNTTTIMIVNFKTSGTSGWLQSSSRWTYILAFALMLFGFTGINLAANSYLRDIQYDFTQNKIYTLSHSTQDLLKNMPRQVTAKVYYTPLLGQRNPEIRLLMDRLYLLLKKYQRLSNGRFNFNIYYPQMLDDTEDLAIASGLQPIPLIDLNQNGYLGLTLTDETGKSQTIPMFTLERGAFLEQDLTSKLYQLFYPKSNLGIISSLPIFDQIDETMPNRVTQQWEIIKQISEFYNIKQIKTGEDFNEDMDALMLIHPQNLSPDIIEHIVTYTLKGGNSLVLLDAAAEAPRLFSSTNNDLRPSQLGELSRLWNFEYFPDIVVADLDNSITVDATNDYRTNPNFTQDVIQFSPKSKNINANETETSGLKNLLFASASVIQPKDLNKISFIPLITSSRNSALMPADVVRRGMNPADILRWFKSDNQTKTIAAKIISKDQTKPFTIIAVTDTDFIYDSFWTKPTSILNNAYNIPILDNGNFILNSLEILSNRPSLADIRGKSTSSHPFGDIERMRRDNQLRFKLKEAEILKKIEQTNQRINEVWEKKDFEQRNIFSADERAVISNYRQELNLLRQELSQIRQELNSNIHAIETKIKLIGIYLIPALILLGFLIVISWKRLKTPSPKEKIYFNRAFFRLFIICFLMLLIGLFSVKYSNVEDTKSFENKLVFNTLAEKINTLHQIKFKSHNQELNFINQNGTWILQENPAFPVYQERMRHFLSILMEARFYEKRTADPKYLSNFGLTPIQSASSAATQITLSDTKGETLTEFELGKINIDIGRGAKGAYIKFPDQFQVWLIKADFIDLGQDWREWTYSSLWNLRFGRLIKTQKDLTPEQLTLLARDLLITPLNSPVQTISTSSPIQQLDILTENRDQVRIEFYQESEKIYVRYLFDGVIKGKHLQFFATYAKDKFYAISKTDMEQITHDITTSKHGTN